MINLLQQTSNTVSENGPQLKKAVTRPEWQLNREQVKLYEKLGSGQFGEVYKG